jgi:hypothetical protein
MMAEPAARQDFSAAVTYIEKDGVKCAVDMYLVEGETLLAISLWGSESQTRAVFAMLAQNQRLSLNDFWVYRTWSHALRFKSRKVGYGKVHAVIWDEKSVPDSVIWFDETELIPAWEMYIKRLTVPYDKDWIPAIARLLEEKQLAIKLTGFGGADGWKITANAEEICDIIVENIFTERSPVNICAASGGNRWTC